MKSAKQQIHFEKLQYKHAFRHSATLRYVNIAFIIPILKDNIGVHDGTGTEHLNQQPTVAPITEFAVRENTGFKSFE